MYRADLTGLRDPSRIIVGMRFELATVADGTSYLRLMDRAQSGTAVSAPLKIVEVFARVPNFIVIPHPRLRGEQQAMLKSQQKAFFADKANGAAFAQATDFTAFFSADDSVMRELDANGVPTRTAMEYSQ